MSRRSRTSRSISSRPHRPSPRPPPVHTSSDVSVAAAGEGTLVARMLAADREVTRRALLSYLPDREPRASLYDLVAEYPSRAAKGIRPALCLATCRAHGGRTEDALGAAVAIELLHNAFLVHDDICDGALLRRGE